MPRPIWTGAISFGLVNIPVRIVTAVHDKGVHFHLLSGDGKCRLRRKLYCPETGKEYDFNETARGFEIAPDQYVLIDQEELNAVKPESGRTIEIAEFVDLATIDPVYYARTYYLIPGEGGAKAYQLLLKAMQKSHRVGIALFVMRERQHVAAIRPAKNGLILHNMFYHDEIVDWKDLQKELPRGEEVSRKQLDVATQLIESLSSDFEPEKYRDDYREKVEKMIEAKAEDESVPVASDADLKAPPPTYNLMEALRKSLKQKPPATRSRRKTTPRRRRKSA